jgi:xanthine dehydrogenase YagS FAD-binding subunit
VDGENQYHAIFGGGPCHIVHPSNLAIALWVCGGNVFRMGRDRDGFRVTQLFQLPSQNLQSEHVLKPEQIITHMTYEPRPHSAFYAIKHKQSFDWPLVAAAVAVELDGTVIRRAAVCAGAVAPVPWPLSRVEDALRGVDVKNDSALRAACDIAREGATPMSGNGYKVTLLPVAVRRAVRMAAGLEAVA